MKILLTNDDGIDAPGLAVLYQLALEFTDAENIFTVAPAHEQSGMGHAITYKDMIQVEHRGPNCLVVYGTPADCILAALHDKMDDKPDLILSGVNKGNNAAQNTLYSGTVGATLEAAMQGFNAIALSQFYGPRLENIDTFDAAKNHGQTVIQAILDANIWESGSNKIHYNVNFPPCSAADHQGHSFTTQGFRAGAPFSIMREDDHLKIIGKPQHEDTGVGTDLHANMSDRTSITPCSIDLTDQKILAKLRAL